MDDASSRAPHAGRVDAAGDHRRVVGAQGRRGVEPRWEVGGGECRDGDRVRTPGELDGTQVGGPRRWVEAQPTPAQAVEGVGDPRVGDIGGSRRGRVVGGDRRGRERRGDECRGRQQSESGDEESGQQGIALLAARTRAAPHRGHGRLTCHEALAVCAAQRTTAVSSTRRTRAKSAPGSVPSAASGNARPWSSK